MTERLETVARLPAILTTLTSVVMQASTLKIREMGRYAAAGQEMMKNESTKDTFDYLSKLTYKEYHIGSTRKHAWSEHSKTFCGNYHVVQLATHIIKMALSGVQAPKRKTGDTYMSSRKISEEAQTLVKIVNSHNIEGINPNSDFSSENAVKMFVSLQDWSDYLENINHEMTKDMKSKVHNNKLSREIGFDKNNDVALVTHSDKYFDIYKIGELSGVNYKENNKSATTRRFFLQTHFNRVITMIRFFASLSIVYYKNFLDESEVMMDMWCNILMELSEVDVSMLGEAIKGARQTYIQKLSSDNIMYDSPTSAYLSTCSDVKIQMIEIVTSYIDSMARDDEAKKLLSDMYKSVPHADANLDSVWATILGFKEPNAVDPTILRRFRGHLTKEIFGSLYRQNMVPRITTDSTEATILQLVALANSTNSNLDRLMKFPDVAWSFVTFLKNDKVTAPENMDIKVRDKSSGPDGPPSFEDFDLLMAFSGDPASRPDELIRRWTGTNDAMAKLQGQDLINDYPALMRRFNFIRKIHEEAEDLEGNIDQMSSEKLEELNKRTGACYVVTTEPKLGEFHKKHTRMFYMAERALKGLTQRVERVARQISRFQPGMSITQSYKARRSDLEEFCNVMGSSPDSSRNPVFVSFDLSEFSKKFPMVLVREYGKILADITGERWLERIDLFFRATTVLHNSRGYFNCASGVKGGFEGFLNFVWSSIHAVVMSLSVASTGLVGKILVFSDDGLLYFIPAPGMTKSEIRGKIFAVMTTYSKLGLDFNLKKTLVSSVIWEYLGDVCYKNHLLPAWMKELSSIGKLMRTKAVNTVADIMDTLIGQFRAAVTNGLPAFLSHFLLAFYSMKKIYRMFPHISPIAVKAMLATPRALGGLRIPTISELHTSSTIHSFAEFEADLVSYSLNEPLVADLINEVITSNLVSPSSAPDCALYGYNFKTTGLRTSGMSVINAIIQEVIDVTSTKISQNPITNDIREIVKLALQSYDNIDVTIFSNFIQSTEAWDSYANSMAIARSSSASKLLSTRSIKKFQSQDTRNVIRAMEIWNNSILAASENSKTINYYKRFNETMTNKVYGSSRIKMVRPSLRKVLTRTNTSPLSFKITIDASKYVGLSKDSAGYSEPNINFPIDLTTASWRAESGSSRSRVTNKMVKSIASICSSAPEYYGILRSLSHAFGVILPIVLPHVSSFQRRTVSANSSSDVMIAPPRFAWACSKVSVEGVSSQALFDLERADRTTYPKLALSNVCMHWENIYHPLNNITSHDSKPKVYKCYIDESEFRNMFVVKPVTLIDQSFDNKADKIANKNKRSVRFEDSADKGDLEEAVYEVRQHNLQDDLYMTKYDDEELNAIIRAAAINKLMWWVKQIYSGGSVTNMPANVLHSDIVIRNGMMEEAIVVGIYQTRDPQDKKVLASWSLSGHEIKEVSKKKRAESTTMILNKFVSDIQDFCATLSTISVKFFQAIYLASDLSNADVIWSVLAKHIDANTLFGDETSKIFVADANFTKNGKMSDATKANMRSIMTNSLTDLYQKFCEAKWNPTEIYGHKYSIMDPDQILDIVTVSRPLLRSSSHRGLKRPYNTTSMRIQLTKFYISCIIRCPWLQFSTRDAINAFTRVTGFDRTEIDPLVRSFIKSESVFARETIANFRGDRYINVTTDMAGNLSAVVPNYINEALRSSKLVIDESSVLDDNEDYDVTALDKSTTRLIGPDHAAMLAAPCDKEYSSRMLVVIKSKWIAQSRYNKKINNISNNSANKGNRFALLSPVVPPEMPKFYNTIKSHSINNVLTLFTYRVLHPMISRIVTYPKELLSVIKPPSNEETYEFPVIVYPNQGRCLVLADDVIDRKTYITPVIGGATKDSTLIDVIDDMVTNQLSISGNMGYNMKHINGFYSNFLSRHQNDRLPGMRLITSSGPYGTVNKHTRGMGCLLVVSYCPDESSALLNYASLMTIQSASACIVKDSRGFILVSVSPSVDIKFNVVARNSLPNLSKKDVRTVALRTYEQTSKTVSSRTDRVFTMGINIISNLHQTRSGNVAIIHAKEVISDPILATVHYLMSYSRDVPAKTLTWSCLLFMAYLSGCYDYETTINFMERLSDDIQANYSDYAHNLSVLASFLKCYMTSEKVIVDAGVDTNIVMSLAEGNPFEASGDYFTDLLGNISNRVFEVAIPMSDYKLFTIVTGEDIFKSTNWFDHIFSLGQINLTVRSSERLFFRRNRNRR